jgi:hypothetical protein
MSPLISMHELERTYTQVDGEIPMVKRVPPKTLELWRKPLASCRAERCAKSWR